MTKAPVGIVAPTIGIDEIYAMLKSRFDSGFCVEYNGSVDETTDEKRVETGSSFDCLRLRDLSSEISDEGGFVTMLVEFVDQSAERFPVVHRRTFTGREISGDAEERGAITAHVVIRRPNPKDLDLGEYRCAVESVAGITRHDIEFLVNRQLRRQASAEELEFPVQIVDKKAGKIVERTYKYYPRIDFSAEVARKFGGGSVISRISQMTFVKRGEKLQIGKPAEVIQSEFTGDVEIRVSARNAPADDSAKESWFRKIKKYYDERGYKTKIYWKHPSGGQVLTGVHKDVAGATDLLMCQREIVELPTVARRWHDKICPIMSGKLKDVLGKEELWDGNGQG